MNLHSFLCNKKAATFIKIFRFFTLIPINWTIHNKIIDMTMYRKAAVDLNQKKNYLVLTFKNINNHYKEIWPACVE